MTTRRCLAALLVATCVTAWFSDAYFHVDEYFQVLELARKKLDPASVAELPWEHTERIRPWLQPLLYWTLGRALGIRDVFALAFVSRLVTGLANVGAVALWLRTTGPWFEEGEARRFHLRLTTLAGFLPYLFVRTSSESSSMVALTVALAVALEGAAPVREDSGDIDERTWSVPALERPRRTFLVGVLFGVAFELRFQTAFVPAGFAAWLLLRTSLPRARVLRVLAIAGAGIALVVAGAALVDRWGYGAWTFPPWSYLRVNVFEGVAKQYGTYPPFAYLWMLPANVFFPVVAVLILLLILAWARLPWHPLTWATLPFVLVHNLLSHKEERFLFPLAIVALTLAALAITPRASVRRRTRSDVVAERVWAWRRGWLGKLVAGWSTAFALLLAFYPLGWNHHVRFFRALHDRFGDEVHATALPDVELFVPPFHPRLWDVVGIDPDEVALRLAADAPLSPREEWLIAPLPKLPPPLAAHAELVDSELPGAKDPATAARLVALVDAYNAHADTPLRKLRYYSLYRLRPSAPRPTGR